MSGWAMLDAGDAEILTPCCEAAWLEPYLLTALCAKCGKPYEVETLGIVRGVRRPTANNG